MLTEEKIKRAKRIAIKQKDLEIRKLFKERERLAEERRKLPWLLLPKPIQNGYKKFFILRADIANRWDAHYFERILGVINSTVYSEDTEFRTKERKKQYYIDHRKRKRRKKMVDVFHDIPHFLKLIDKKDWEKLNWPSHFTKYFRFVVEYTPHPWGVTRREGYKFIYPYYFEPKIEPHFLTHYQERDLDLESKIAELDHRAEIDNLWPLYIHLINGSNNYRSDDWWTPKQVQIQHKMHTSQRALQDEANSIIYEKRDDELMRRWLEERYGFSVTPYDNPYYLFDVQ